MERRPGAVQDSACGHRRLVATVRRGALPEEATVYRIGLAMAATRTTEPLGPPGGHQILQARFLAPELELELQQVRREGGLPHVKSLTQMSGIMLSEGDKH